MNKIEKLVVCGSLAACVTLGLGLNGLIAPALAHNSAVADGNRIATVDVLSVVEKLASSDRYMPAREEKIKSLRAPIEVLQKELDELRTKITAIPDFQTNAEAQPLIQQFQQKNQTMQSFTQQAQTEAESFNTGQLQEAYKIVLETVSTIATSRGYTHVFSTRLPDNKMTSTNVQGMLQEMLARPLIKAPPADDLTQDVIKELKLENVKTGPVATPAAPAAAIPPAPAATPAPATPAPATPPSDKKN
jgi:Skp family chaperone for outer membrane proteins